MTTPTGYRAVLAVKGLRPVFVAHAVSMAGTVAAEVALSILIFQRTGSALLSALVFVCSFMPYAVGGTVLSSVADRYPARRVLVACDLISAACIATMLVPGIPVAALLGLLLATGTVAPIFAGARGSSLVHLLGPDVFPLGRSLLRAISQTTVLAGFAIGSVVVAAVGPTWLLAGDVASFVASALLIRFGTPHTPANAPDGDRSARSLIGESLSGLRYVFTTPPLRRLILLSWAPSAFGSGAEGLAVAYTAQTGARATAAGALYTGYAAGTVLTEVLVARLSPPRRRRLMVPLLLLTQLPSIAFIVTPSVPVAAALMVVAGCGFAFNQGLDPLILAASPDPGHHGRLFTVQSSGLMTVQGAGIALGGIAAGFLRPSLVIVTAGAIGTAAIVILLRRQTQTPAVWQ